MSDTSPSPARPNGSEPRSLEEHLHEPSTEAALHRILDRMDRIEQALARLTEAVDQAPAVAPTMVDVVDDVARAADARGVDLDERLQNVLTLAERLTAPKTVEVLTGLLDRLDQVEQLTALLDQAPGFAAMTVDMADEAARRAAERGIDLDERLHGVLGLVEKLSAPETVRVLSALLARVGDLEQLLALADQAPGFVAMMVDVADEWAARAAERGTDVETMLHATAAAARRLTELVGSAEFQALLDSGVLDPRALGVVGTAGQALVRCQEECLSRPEPPKTGLFGLLRAAREPEMQRTLAFLVHFGRFFGEAMAAHHRRPTLPPAGPTNAAAS